MITWNDAPDGSGNGLSWPPTAGDTLDANGYDIDLDADVEVTLTAISGTWVLGAIPTYYANVTVQCPVYSAASPNIFGTWTLADTLTTEQITIWGTVTISGSGAIIATTIIIGPNGQISDIDACDGAIQGVAPDWPAESDVKLGVDYDNATKTGTYSPAASASAYISNSFDSAEMKKNTAIPNFPIGKFLQTADGAEKTEGTPTCTRILDGTAASMENAASYHATGGQWVIDLAAADTNGDMVGYTFELADCYSITHRFATTTKRTDELNDTAAADVWGYGTRGITANADKTGYSLETAPPTAAQIKTALEAVGGHLALILEDTGTTLPAALASILEDTGTTIPASLTTVSTLDAAGVRIAVGLAAANLDTQLAALTAPTTQSITIQDETITIDD